MLPQKWQNLVPYALWSLFILSITVLTITIATGFWLFAATAQEVGLGSALRSVDPLSLGLTAGGIATMLGIAIAALVGYYKFHLFGEGRPHLNIGLYASHRPASPRFTQIGATARLVNTSKVAITISRCTWELYAIAPYDDDVLQNKADAWIQNAGKEWDEFPWNWIQKPITMPLEMTIESGEIEEVTFDFVIDQDIRSVTITCQVPNDEYPSSSKSNAIKNPGWSRRIFYDLSAAP